MRRRAQVAPEQILRVLIAHMAEGEPKFLDRVQQLFTNHHAPGADEQDYTHTAGSAEQFIQQVAPERQNAPKPGLLFLRPRTRHPPFPALSVLSCREEPTAV
jgi:hypothetical protein